MKTDQAFNKQVQQDIGRVKEDLATLVDDGATGFNRFEDKVGHATGKAEDELTTWADDGADRLRSKLEKFAGEAQKTMDEAAKTVKDDIGHGLIQYNTEVQKVANKAPGGFGKKAAEYPWVAVTISLVLGMLLGGLLKPSHHPAG